MGLAALQAFLLDDVLGNLVAGALITTSAWALRTVRAKHARRRRQDDQP